MIHQCQLLLSAISEYDSMANAEGNSDLRNNPERLARTLAKDHDWTDRGAEAVAALANEYGAFMLRNALALAIVLNKEDGDLDF